MIEGLVFEPVEHRYFFNGASVPNVTSILEVIDETWRVDPDVLKAAGDRGTAVHLACELEDRGDLDEEQLDDQLRPYLAGWRRFKSEMGFTVTANEQRIWHPKFRYAGTLDRKGTFARWPAHTDLVDIKSGAEWPSHGPQVAAYQDAEQVRTKQKIARRWCVYLDAEGRYRMVEKKEADDFAVFLSCLQITRYRQRTAA